VIIVVGLTESKIQQVQGCKVNRLTHAFCKKLFQVPHIIKMRFHIIRQQLNTGTQSWHCTHQSLLDTGAQSRCTSQ
jgi:hypothetical protein